MDQLIDSHCHLHEPWFNDLSNVIKNAKQNDVTKIIKMSNLYFIFKTFLKSADGKSKS